MVASRGQGGGGVSARLSASDPTERRRAAKALAGRLPLFLRPLARFVYIYFFRRGFLDGRAGFVYAFMLAVYEAMIAILVHEQTQPGGANRIPPPNGRQP